MITALCFASILILAVNGQVFPSLLTRLGGSSVQQGLLLSSLFILFPISSIAAGLAADRSSKRLIIMLGLGSIATAFALSAWLASIQARILSVLLFGLGGGAVESQTSALLSDLNPDRERSIINFSQTFFSAGAAGGPFLISMTMMVNRSMAPTTFLWVAALIPLIFIIGFSFTRRVGSSHTEISPEGLITLLKNGELRLLTVIIFLYVAAEMGTAAWLAKYGEVHLTLSPALAPICLTIFWAGLGLSRTVASLLPSRVSNSSLLTGSMLLSLAAQVATFSHTSKIPALIGIGLMGFGMGSVWPTLVAIVGAHFKNSSGTAVGIMVAAGGLGIPFIQPLVGFLSRQDLLGLRYTLLGLSAITLLNIFLTRRALVPKSA